MAALLSLTRGMGAIGYLWCVVGVLASLWYFLYRFLSFLCGEHDELVKEVKVLRNRVGQLEGLRDTFNAIIEDEIRDVSLPRQTKRETHWQVARGSTVEWEEGGGPLR